jgi:hypothetical protein
MPLVKKILLFAQRRRVNRSDSLAWRLLTREATLRRPLQPFNVFLSRKLVVQQSH